MGWSRVEVTPKERHRETQRRLGMNSPVVLRGQPWGAEGLLFHSLLSSVRGRHVLEDSTAASAGQAALQGAVAKPHVLHHDSAETWRDRALQDGCKPTGQL